MIRRRLEVPPENLSAQFAPLTFPFVTTEKPPDVTISSAGRVEGRPLQGVKPTHT